MKEAFMKIVFVVIYYKVKKNAKTLTIQTLPTIKEEDFTKIKLEVKGLFDLKECSQMNFCMVSEGYN